MEELLVMEPIIAYRLWLITYDGKRLSGAIFKFLWHEGVNFAQCMRIPWKHSAPEFHCVCGFYAYKTIEYCQREMPFRLDSVYQHVFGEVELTGKVVEHEHGYRSEKAQVRKLVLSPSHEHHRCKFELERIAEHYKVPLVNHDDYFYYRKQHWMFEEGGKQ